MTRSPAPTRRCRHFEADPSSVALARRFVAEVLTGEGGGTVETVQAIVSELASNCVRHAVSSFEVCVVEEGGHLRVEVADAGAGLPVPTLPAPDELGGRGLLIVGALADDWGVVPDEADAGKTVWFTVAGR